MATQIPPSGGTASGSPYLPALRSAVVAERGNGAAFRVILRNLCIVFAIIAVLMPFLPRHKLVVNTDSLPERVVQLVMEPPPPPPPPPPPKPEKPIEKAPVAPKPVPQPVDPRVKASKSGLLATSTTWPRCATRSISTNSRKTRRRPTIPATSAW